MRAWGIVLTGVFALAACGKSPDSPESPDRAVIVPTAASCAMATEFLGGWDKADATRPVVFDDEPESPLLPLSEDGWSGGEKPKSGAPPKVLIDKFNSTELVSAVKSCAAVRARLDNLGYKYGAAMADALGKKGYDVVGLAAPVMSEDGTGALLVQSSRSFGSFGHSMVQYMQRNKDGHWVLVAARHL